MYNRLVWKMPVCLLQYALQLRLQRSTNLKIGVNQGDGIFDSYSLDWNAVEGMRLDLWTMNLVKSFHFADDFHPCQFFDPVNILFFKGTVKLKMKHNIVLIVKLRVNLIKPNENQLKINQGDGDSDTFP